MTSTGWFYWALLSAVFAALTAIFAKVGLQTASGVPLMCDEGPDFKTFRLGLFGLDKLADVAGAVARLEAALDQLAPAAKHAA